MACSKVSLGGACAQALPGKVKAAPTIAVVRISFSFIGTPLDLGP